MTMLPMHILVENYGQAPDKPKNLTVQGALKGYPNECLAVIPPQAGKLKITNDPGTVQLMGDESDGHWHVEDECGEWLELTWAELLGAAARWLAGKEVLTPRRGTIRRSIDSSKRSVDLCPATWPEDPLRYYLEEVKAHAPTVKTTEDDDG